MTASLVAFRCRLKMFRTKFLARVIRTWPARPAAVELASRLFALQLAISKKDEKKAIVRAAGPLGLDTDGRSLARRFFLQTARSLIWSSVIYDVNDLQKYVSVVSADQLKEATAGGRGAVLVGAHFGPSLHSFALWREGVTVRPLAGGNNWRKFHRFFAGSPESGKTEKVRFLESVRMFPSHGGERAMVRHVKSGGVVLLLIDQWQTTGVGSPASFFGGDWRFSHFPFKLALRYGAPLFFCDFQPEKIGFSLRLTSVDDIETPAEGVRRYTAFLEGIVREHPHMWRRLAAFCQDAGGTHWDG